MSISSTGLGFNSGKDARRRISSSARLRAVMSSCTEMNNFLPSTSRALIRAAVKKGLPFFLQLWNSPDQMPAVCTDFRISSDHLRIFFRRVEVEDIAVPPD